MKPIFIAMRSYLDESNSDKGLPVALVIRLDTELIGALERHSLEMEAAIGGPQRVAQRRFPLPFDSYRWLSVVDRIERGGRADLDHPATWYEGRWDLSSVPGFYDPEYDSFLYAGSRFALGIQSESRSGDVSAPCTVMSDASITTAEVTLDCGPSVIDGMPGVKICVEAKMGEERLFTYATTWATIHPELNRHLNGAPLFARPALFASSPYAPKPADGAHSVRVLLDGKQILHTGGDVQIIVDGEHMALDDGQGGEHRLTMALTLTRDAMVRDLLTPGGCAVVATETELYLDTVARLEDAPPEIDESERHSAPRG